MTVIVPEKLRRRLAQGPVRGYVPAVEELHDGTRVQRLIPQHKAARVNTPNGMDWNDASDARGATTHIPVSEIERIRASLPATVRSTAQEKYQQLVKTLYADAERQFKRDGRVVWPKSIETELAILGVAEGKTHLVEQVEALASRFIVKAAREQQAEDRRKVTLDWHGHVSA